jgi:hypothetical protein
MRYIMVKISSNNSEYTILTELDDILPIHFTKDNINKYYVECEIIKGQN